MDAESSQENLSNPPSTVDQVSNDGTPSTVAITNNDELSVPAMDSTKEGKEQIAADSPGSEPFVDPSSLHLQPSHSSETSEASRASSPESADDQVDEDDAENLEGEEDEEETGQLSQSSTRMDASSTTNMNSSAVSIASGDDDASDVCSSIAESENADSTTTSLSGSTSKPTKRKRSRQPSIMIGYKKRRKTAVRKYDDESSEGVTMKMSTDAAENGSGAVASPEEEDKSEITRRSLEPSSSEENLSETSISNSRSRKYSSVANEVTGADKFCWICHKEGGSILKCITCPRIFHTKCHFQAGVPEGSNYDPSNFHCPECSAVLKADNVNTRSPVLVTVNLEQLCTLLKHIITILKSQKDSHYFYGPVDTKEFPHYRHYVVYPMDISVLERNIKNKVYGCTEAFLADVKWIVHNSIVFNSRAAKITNVAKNLLKLCKREILEIETCAECYYNSLVRKDTWFIEVCKRPHLLVWARLKGYPPWPAKAMKCKEGMVDCRFFGAHDKAWVPLKDCFLYSKVSPQPVKVKKGSHLENGIQELEKHIEKLQDKFGSFTYPAARIPYQPSQEVEQLQMMLPNYNPTGAIRHVHVDRILKLQPKTLFGDGEEKPVKEEDESLSDNEDKLFAWGDGKERVTSEEIEKTSDSPPHDFAAEDSSSGSSSDAETSVAATPPHSSAAKTETPYSSPTKTSSEPSNSPRKLVSVKNIESINASVPNTPNASPRSAQTPEVTAGGSKVDDSRGVSPLIGVPSKSLVAPIVTLPRIQHDLSVSDFSSPEVFDLNKVKDEPLESEEPMNVDDLKISESPIVDHLASSTTPILAPSVVNIVKRPFEMVQNSQPVKKVKVDPKCRTVKITENVTLSLINQSPSPEPPKSRPLAPVVKQRPYKAVPMAVPLVIPATAVVMNTSSIAPSVSRSNFGNLPSNDLLRPKVMAPTVLPFNGSVVAVNRPNTKVQPRIVNNVVQTNGMLCVPTKPAVTVTPSRSSSKVPDSFNDLFNKVMNESVAECHAQFRRIFESTLDKLVGKGDPKSRLVALKKEMDVMKRNHDLFIDEMKRDYEVQIAELRATSVAKTQFDLAAERLKFEQEKERAVKEAKSKQWCSNCQKIANYYCCWNTAYCDFECQKEHWMQHMNVCKNDVKKKTAESSENEPPRIMMQSELSNGYLTNGYDKTGSSFSYGNVGAAVVPSHSLPRNSNFNRPRIKVSTVVRNRPLLPQTISTVSSSPSSNSSAINGAVAQSTYQNPSPSAYSIGTNASAVYSPLFQK